MTQNNADKKLFSHTLNIPDLSWKKCQQATYNL